MAAPTDDTAAKQRIITHMNADHQDSLIRYLEHYHSVPTSTARTARLDDVSLSGMIISARNKQYTIPFDPPLQSYRECRERVVEMHHEALKGLGRSDISITEYAPPEGFQKVVFAACIFGYFQFAYRDQYVPGNPIYEAVYGYIPGWAKFWYAWAPTALVLMLGIHVFEAGLMHRLKMRRHNVEMGSKVWWQWIGSTFIEGFGAFQRINSIVSKKQEEKDKRKH